MNDWKVRTKEELIISVSESNGNKQLGRDWMTSSGFCSHCYFIVNHELDTIGYRGIVATREEINYYSKTGLFMVKERGES